MADDRYSDHDVVEEMLQPFRDQFYLELPPDPRIIDPAQINALRERILSPYSYKWRGEDANFEIAEAIFGARRSGNRNNVIHQITDSMLRDERGHSTFSRFPGPEFKKFYYVTVAISTLPDYIHAEGPAVALLEKVFPGFGYDYEFRSEHQRLRLVGEDEVGPWIESDHQPKMLVAAVLELLERYPERAPQWRRL
ncbi:hypothetical protein FV228_00160 [Methylobacterium sp. WL18]|uniref:hypothetical protein n=1 Tax=Methylobacterium sp. WL18 TaxID=2603897 RepID=UPI0011CAD07C|nr:hypothetical protein [Methylobacterium sp. WL18]TXN76602.1 hypothetical protein FV228_00160 [Methylobacterium sp. WL18]